MPSLDPITVSVTVDVDAARAWKAFTDPTSITQWNFASPDWHCPQARSDLREGGSFSYRMEARDGSFGFDYEGTFREVSPNTRLRLALGEDREVIVDFVDLGGRTRVDETFTPEPTHSLEQQLAGWQAILDNYKAHLDTAGSPA